MHQFLASVLPHHRIVLAWPGEESPNRNAERIREFRHRTKARIANSAFKLRQRARADACLCRKLFNGHAGRNAERPKLCRKLTNRGLYIHYTDSSSVW